MLSALSVFRGDKLLSALSVLSAFKGDLLWGYFYESIELECSWSIIQYKSEQGILYSNLVRKLFL